MPRKVSDLEYLRDRISKRKDEAMDLESEKEDARREINRLEDELGALEDEIDDIESKIEDINQDVDELESELAMAESELIHFHPVNSRCQVCGGTVVAKHSTDARHDKRWHDTIEMPDGEKRMGLVCFGCDTNLLALR